VKFAVSLAASSKIEKETTQVQCAIIGCGSGFQPGSTRSDKYITNVSYENAEY